MGSYKVKACATLGCVLFEQKGTNLMAGWEKKGPVAHISQLHLLVAENYAESASRGRSDTV
jgi:hypothetical protein